MHADRKLGPNAKNLLTMFIARESVPDGGGLADGLKFFTDAEHRKRVIETAMTNLDLSIAAIRAAPDNPYGDDEEVIAAAILLAIELKKEDVRKRNLGTVLRALEDN